MRHALLVFFCLCFPAFVAQLCAQQVGSTTYSIEEGFPQSEVFTNCLLQDKNGVLWAGTNGGGIVRKEGEHFNVFDTQKGIVGNVSRMLTEDIHGTVWAYMFNKGITGFTTTGIKNYTLPILSDPRVGGGALLTDSLGGLVFLSRLTGKNLLLCKAAKADSLEDMSENVAFEGPNEVLRSVGNFQGKGILLTTNFNVYRFRPQTQTFTPLPLKGYTPKENKPLVFINEDQKGRLWFREPGSPNALVYWDSKSGERKDFVFPRNLLGPIMRVVYDQENDATWFLERMISIWRHTEKEGFREISLKNGLPVKTYQDLLLDEENNIWVATSGGGLLKLAPLYFENYTTKEGLPENIIFGVHRRPDSTLFFSPSTEGIAIQKNGQISKLNANINVRRPACFLERQDGSLLIGCYAPGVLKWENGQLQNVNATYGIPNGTPIIALHENDSLLFFGSFNAGVYVYNKNTKQTHILNAAKGLGNNGARSLVPDSQGNLWVAHATGIAKIPISADTAYSYVVDPNKQMSIQLDVDTKDRVWVATYGSGLLLVKEGKTQAIFNTKNGLAADIVYSVLCGKDGSVWVGTQKGIDRLWVNDAGEITKKQHFDRSNGFLGQELNGNAISQEENGDMWFGHLHGAAHLRVSQLPKGEVYVPQTHISALNFYLDRTNWRDSVNRAFHKGLEGVFQLPKALHLPYNKNSLVFKFFSTSQQPEDNIEFQWRLIGQDSDWLPITSRNEATYSNLAPSSYTFKVRSRVKGGAWGEEKSFSFTVEPPFWQRPSFIVLAIVSFFALLYAGYRWRVRAIKLHQQELERLVEKRTKEVVQQKDEILEKNVELEQQKEEILTQNEEIEQKNRALEGANHEIRQQNDNITASINYARRIQYAMLPSEKQIQTGFKESFLFFKPRDVVSGDFAWYAAVEKQGKKHYVLAAVDCTGHGVPGAFMSFLGEGYLNQIVNLEKELDPSVVLFKLDYHITRALEQDHNTVQSADGMDIALCVYVPTENRLCFSGAKNPLIYVQNEEMHYIKGSRSPIGGKSLLKAAPEFHAHEVSLNTTTTAYIYSDGFQDQFGGKKDKKYMSKRFRKYLAEISALPLAEQKTALANELQQWKGELPQVDDVLVIGFRLTPTD